MSWWLAGLDIQSTKKYNLAARWLLRQSGVVRQRGEEFDPRDLEFQKEIKMPNAETGDDEVVVEEDPLSGINKLLTALEEMTGRSSLDKRGELRNVFYLELKRKSGERISEFATRYRGLVAELKAEGVTIHDGELGWWFKQKLGLDPLRTQLLETALAGAEDYPTIEREVLRLFKDLHAADPLYRRSGDADQKAPLLSRFLNQQSGASRASSYAPSMTSSAARSLRSGSSTASSGRMTPSSTYRRPFQKQAMVSEVEEEIPATAEAGDDDGVEEEVEPPSLEEVLTTEAEVLAAELDAAASQGVDPETLQEIEESVEAAAEAFLTMKEARSKLQEVRKDRGYGKAASSSTSSPASKVSLKKQSDKHPCFDCGLPGHWAGDPECSKPGQQLGRKKKVAPKQVKVAEALNTEHEEITTPDHEVMMLRHESPVLTDAFLSTVQQFHEPKEVNALGLALDKRLVGALDSACNRTCTGADWLKGYLRGLETSAPSEVLDLVRREPERETFRFGNGGTQVSEERWRLPTMIGGTVVCFWTSVVPVSSLGLLLGRDFLEAIGAVMNFSRKALRCDLTDGTEIPLSQLAAGHYALHLLPERWPGLDPQRWRRLGLDGVLEVQFPFQQLIRRRLKTKGNLFKKTVTTNHDHFVTESSMQAGRLVSTMLSSDRFGSVQAPSMSAVPVDVLLTTTSSSTRTTPSSTTRDDGQRGLDLREQDGEPVTDSVAKVRAEAPRKVSLGGQRSVFVGAAKAALALLAVALSLHGDAGSLAAARPEAGGRWARVQEALGSGLHHGQVRLQELDRVRSLARPHGRCDLLLRRSGGHGNDPWQDGKRPQGQDEECRHGGGPQGSKGGGSRRQQGGDGSSLDRTSRRTAVAARRLAEARSLAERGDQGRGQRRDHQGEAAPHGQPAEREACAATKQGEVQGKGRSIQSSRLDGGLQRRPGDRTLSRDGFLSALDRHAQPVPDDPRQHGTRDPGVEESAEGSGQCGLDLPGQVPLRQFHVSGPGGGSATAGGRSPVTGERLRGPPHGLLRDECTASADARGPPEGLGPVNPFMLHQSLKPGQATLIAQAWAQHESDRKRISQEPRKIRQILEAEYYQDMEHFMNDETFFQHIDLHPHSNDVHVNEAVTGKRSSPLLTEVYTTAQNVSKVAAQRGHHVGQAMSLETGWNFLRADHRALAKEKIQKEKPFCLVLAFPCGPFSPLQHLNARGKRTWPQRLEDGRTLMRFALELAKLQLKEKRHCILENPKPSAAWKEPEMRKFIEENDVHEAAFDQCRFGLMNLDGQLRRKATVVASSSPLVVERLHGMCCRRDHDHAQVIGGSKVTAHAGIYPLALARAFVRGIEDQFDKDHKAYELLAVDVGGNEEEDSHPAVHDVSEDEDDEYQLQPSEVNMTIPAAIKAAIKRLHENTGHRSNRRLARALTLAGAPVEAIVAAKRHKCDVCRERAPPKLKRPASLPSPKDFGDQVHIDLLEVEDGREQKYVIAHCTDAVTKYQAAEILPNKSTAAVIEFLSKRWVPAFGPPRVLVCDQGREFISWEMEEWASSMSVMLHHVAVQAPWQNGIAEKSGGVLKTLMSAIVTSKSVVTKDEMEMALGEAVAAYNGDVDGESGCSPYQAVLGRQPRMVGDVLGGVQQRLSEHGLIESKPSLARQVALREVAKLAMTRLHFSRGLRRAELARSRSSTVENAPKPGTVCYFYRPLRYNSKTGQSKKKLTLKRWHGPAMMVAQDGHASAFLSYKGQLTKCALEHVRVASTMEQIASGAWGEAIKEAVEDAKYEVALRQPRSDANTPEEPGPPPLPVLPETTAEGVNPRTPAFLPSSTEAMPADENQLDGEDLPPVKPQELWQMMVPSSSPVTSQVASTLPSRRVSDFSESPFPETTRKAFSRKSSGLPLETVRERAKMLDDRSETGQKRPADVDIDQLRDQEQGHSSAAAASGSGAEHDTLLGERLTPAEIADELGRDDLHPLRKAYLLAEQDKRDPLEAMVPDHGTWHGKWTLPSRSEWQARQNLGLDWPTGDSTEAEVLAVQANRKEFRWKTMSETEKEAFKEAARQAWAVWEENDAVEILTPEESSRVRRRLAGAHEGSKILTPRYVFTDKHEGLRTAENPLPLRARARVIVPGYKDVFSYSLRKDAPTGSRVAQHLLFTFTASHARASKESEKLWRLMSADVKSAFLKGDAYVDGQRELFLENVRGDDPKLPFGNCLAKIRKGVFGLSDAPRQWYLRLNRSLQAAGWERTVFDYACWLLWSEDRQNLEGIILSHVDDLLLGGNVRAQNSLLMIGQELGFGSVEYDDFVYCGKRVQMKSDGSVVINMQAYHENLRPMEISLARRKTPEAELTEQERRQLRAVLGSLQWLVAQVRFDQGYALSTLQGEKPLVGTLIKANRLIKEFKRRPNFSLTFQPMNLATAGIMTVSDSSLGNVLKGGGSEGEPHEKHYSQSAYFVIVGDQDLMSGKEGVFNVIDARSHRLPRVCRSTYGAELMGVEEGMDMGIFCRGGLGAFLGLPMGRRDALKVMEVIPMVAITDAKDTYDRGNSDCPTYGAQKSMAFSVCWIRQVLNGSNSHLKWTATANMWVDAGTKLMPCDHMQSILEKGRWSFVYHQDYVKQSPKKKGAAEVSEGAVLPGEPMDTKAQLFQFILNLSNHVGWHEKDNVIVQVACPARSYRVPDARYGSTKYPFRSTFARFDLKDGRSVWRILEHREDLREVEKRQALLPFPASCLVSIFLSQATKNVWQLKKHAAS